MSLYKSKHNPIKLVSAKFDVANHPDFGAVVASQLATGAYTLGVWVPDNAIIINSFYDVTTTFTTGVAGGTLALHIEGAGDIVAATAVNDARLIWNAGIHSTKVPFGANSAFLETDITAATPGANDFAIAAMVAEGGAGNNAFSNANEGDTAMSALGAVQSRYRLLSEGEASPYVKTTANRELTATLGAQVFTAGVLIWWVEYVISE